MLAMKVAGMQASPNADLQVAREIALNAELLQLAGAIVIHRRDGRASFELTAIGRNSLPKRLLDLHGSGLRASGSILAISTALCSCTSIFSSRTAPQALPSINDVRQLQSVKIEQVTDGYRGHTYFAACTDCLAPTPKTLATDNQTSPITQFMPPELLERARELATPRSSPAASPSIDSGNVPKLERTSSPENVQNFVERRYVVFFRFGHHAVDPLAQLELARVATHLSAAQSVVVVGSTDSIGPAAVNDQLALRRARAVFAVLKAAGVSEARTDVKAIPNRSLHGITAASVIGPALPATVSARARHAEIVARVPDLANPRLVSAGEGS